MRTITLQIDDRILEKFLWLLSHFSRDEVQILNQPDNLIDYNHLHNTQPSLTDFYGLLQNSPNFNEDPLVCQQALRHEWD